jgi:hypothetical protein
VDVGAAVEQDHRVTGMDFSPNFAATATLPWPAISTLCSSTRTGFVHPQSLDR